MASPVWTPSPARSAQIDPMAIDAAIQAPRPPRLAWDGRGRILLRQLMDVSVPEPDERQRRIGIRVCGR